MSTLQIVELSCIGVAVLGILIYCIVVGIKKKWFSQLFETLKDAIKEAEALYPDAGSGDKKKAFVLEKIEEKCKELGIPYNLLKKLISLAIDEIISDYNIIAKK